MPLPQQPSPELGWSLEEPPSQDNRMGIVERRMLERGKKEHRETTLATTRALQVAEQCQEMASSTLIEVQRQGHSLDKVEHGLETVEQDVKEAGRIIRFMRRWCCFQVLCCCDCFDPDAAMDKTRQKRVKIRAQEEAAMAESQREFHLAQQAAVLRMANKRADPAYNGSDDARVRSELFAANIRRKTSSREDEALPGLGYGLPDADTDELQQETRLQDENLDRIGTTVENLKLLSLDIQGELESQAPQIDRLGDRAHAAHDNLTVLAKSTRRI